MALLWVKAVMGLSQCRWHLRDFDGAVPLLNALIGLCRVERRGDGGISIGSELHSVAALGTTVPPLRTLLFRRASCLKNAAEPRRADLQKAMNDISVCRSMDCDTTAAAPRGAEVTSNPLDDLAREVTQQLESGRRFAKLSAAEFQSKAVAWAKAKTFTPGDPLALPAPALSRMTSAQPSLDRSHTVVFDRSLAEKCHYFVEFHRSELDEEISHCRTPTCDVCGNPIDVCANATDAAHDEVRPTVVGFSCRSCEDFDMCGVCATLMPACALEKLACPRQQGGGSLFAVEVRPEGVDHVAQARGQLATSPSSDRLPELDSVWGLQVAVGEREDSGNTDTGTFGVISKPRSFVGRFRVVLKSVNARNVGKGMATQVLSDLTREAMLHARLSHPHIIVLVGAVFGKETRDGPTSLSLVLEHADCSLAVWLKGHPSHGKGLSNKMCSKDTALQRTEFMLHVCRALVYLHKHGVVHGDLHMGNILVCDGCNAEGNDPVLKLCDFGRAVDPS